MLKWAVTQRRESDAGRPRTADAGTKRRRSGVARRRSERDKENRYTSTPIKSSEEHGALRDVSNLTPKEGRGPREDVRCNDFARFEQKKKKKRCLDPAHSDAGKFFRPFESVDSHIGSLLVEGRKSFAPTLPTYSTEYSPFRATNLLAPNVCCSLKPSLEELCPPNKKARIDHVNDFLHQISQVAEASPEKAEGNGEIKVSPLVQRLVDLRFNKRDCDKRRGGINDSSFINELSLDQIVDAILDSSGESKTAEERVKENELNETREENLINTENERLFNISASLDSGFRSNSTENSHHIDSNFFCRCNAGKSPEEKTIINLEETYNERCVDVPASRKRPSAASEECGPRPKRRLLDDDAEFTLRRQKCIRRRKNTSVETAKKALPLRRTEPKGNSSDGRPSIYSENTPALSKSDVVSSLEKTCSDLQGPSVKIRSTRRCLKFDSPDDSSRELVRCSTPKSEEKGARGALSLKITYENEELLINGRHIRLRKT